MRSVRFLKAALPAVLLFAGSFTPVFAAAEDWHKSYPVSGKPLLAISTGDASLEIHPCGECHEIRINVDWKDRRPSDFTLKEAQSGDQVRFQLDEKAPIGIHFTVGNRHAPHLTVESPATLDLEAKTTDGSLKISNIEGSLQLRTSDGVVDLEDVKGAVRLTASDGAIKIHNLIGTLESRSSDGRAVIDGKFTALQMHLSDGNLDLTISEGSKLANPSRIESADGMVRIRLPRTLAADLDIHAGDGKIECSLPVMTEGFNSLHGSGHSLRGHLNGGGTPLVIHTNDGSVNIGPL